MIFFLYNS